MFLLLLEERLVEKSIRQGNIYSLSGNKLGLMCDSAEGGGVAPYLALTQALGEERVYSSKAGSPFRLHMQRSRAPRHIPLPAGEVTFHGQRALEWLNKPAGTV